MNEDQKTADLEIGQVIYVLSNKQQKIVPAIVIEEAVIRTMNGNQTTWKVSVGPSGREKIIDSSRLDGEIYVSLEEIKEALHQRLLTFLEEMLSEANERAVLWYGESSHVANYDLDENSTGKIDPNRLLEDIESPNNKKPSMKPTVKPPFRTGRLAPKNPGDILRDRMESMMSEEQETRNPNDAEIVGTDEISLPDGQRVKVNVKI